MAGHCSPCLMARKPLLPQSNQFFNDSISWMGRNSDNGDRFSSMLLWSLLNIEDDFSGDLGCNSTHLRTPLPAMASHFMKGLTLFRNEKSINFSVPNLVDLPAKSMPNFLFKEIINPACWPHRPSVLFYIFKPLPANQ